MSKANCAACCCKGWPVTKPPTGSFCSGWPPTCAHFWGGACSAGPTTWRTWFSADGLGRLVKASLQDITTTRRLKESVYRLEWPLRTAKAGLRQAAARTLGVLRPHLRANR